MPKNAPNIEIMQFTVNALKLSHEMQSFLETAYKLGRIHEAENWLNTGESVTYGTMQ